MGTLPRRGWHIGWFDPEEHFAGGVGRIERVLAGGNALGFLALRRFGRPFLTRVDSL